MARNGNRLHSLRDIAANLHIKGDTAGTSNELSLSVLDERSKNAGEKSSTTPRLARVNKVSVFAVQPKKGKRGKSTGDAPAGADVAGYALDLSSKGRAARARRRALDDPEGEIRRRKSARRARRIVATVIGAAASIALIGFAAFNIWGAYEKKQENISILDQAMTELEAADEVVLSLDALVTDGIGDTPDEDLQALAAKADSARTHIHAAAAFANTAYEAIGQSTDREAAQKVKDSAAAREEMIDDALAIVAAESEARTASNAIQECWQHVLSADALLKEAAQLVVETTNENVSASQEKTEQARELLYQADSSLFAAQQACPAADFSDLQAYIDKRLEAIGYALASDEAIYIQDKATADDQNARYNQADAEAVEIARSLPDDPAQPIRDILEEGTQEARAKYLETREAAAQSDAFIRDYLGGRSQ